MCVVWAAHMLNAYSTDAMHISRRGGLHAQHMSSVYVQKATYNICANTLSAHLYEYFYIYKWQSNAPFFHFVCISHIYVSICVLLKPAANSHAYGHSIILFIYTIYIHIYIWYIWPVRSSIIMMWKLKRFVSSYIT